MCKSRTCAHTFTHTHTHTYTNTNTHTCTHLYTHTHTRAHKLLMRCDPSLPRPMPFTLFALKAFFCTRCSCCDGPRPTSRSSALLEHSFFLAAGAGVHVAQSTDAAAAQDQHPDHPADQPPQKQKVPALPEAAWARPFQGGGSRPDGGLFRSLLNLF